MTTHESMDVPAADQTYKEQWAVIGGDQPGIYNNWYDSFINHFNLLNSVQSHSWPTILSISHCCSVLFIDRSEIGVFSITVNLESGALQFTHLRFFIHVLRIRQGTEHVHGF